MPKSVAGFNPGLPRENTIALPLAPPLLPVNYHCYRSFNECCSTLGSNETFNKIIIAFRLFGDSWFHHISTHSNLFCSLPLAATSCCLIDPIETTHCCPCHLELSKFESNQQLLRTIWFIMMVNTLYSVTLKA